MNKKAFTTVELLVVIAIITIIAALLMPAIFKGQESGRRSQCVSKMRQIGVAMHIYIDDHDFNFPPFSNNGVKWFHYLEPYLDDREVFNCPTYKKHDYNDPTHFSYGFNYEGLNNGPPYVGIDINSVRMTAQCIMISDGGQQAGDLEDISRYSISKTQLPSPRHLNGANILFVDNHVKYHTIADIPTSGGISELWWNY